MHDMLSEISPQRFRCSPRLERRSRALVLGDMEQAAGSVT